MKNIFIIIFTLALTACASTVALEVVHIKAPNQGWKVGYAKDKPGQGNIVEYVHKKENINNWSEMITIQFLENSTDSPAGLMYKLETAMKNRCHSTYWNTIDQDETSILYEWKISKCKDNPDQHEIARIFQGNDGVHRAAFTIKTSKIDSQVRENWIKYLKDSELTKDGKKVVVNAKK